MTKNLKKFFSLVVFLAAFATSLPANAANELVTLTSKAGDLPLPNSHPRLDAARSLVGADWTIENGFTGKGVSIAVLDSGIQGDHVQFAGRILAQICSAHSESSSTCRGKSLFDDSSGSAEYSKNSDGLPLDSGVNHGTAVASTIFEFAPDVRIIMLKDDRTNGIFKNLEWVIQNAKKYNIVAVNMSMGNPFQGAPGWPRNEGICENTQMADDYAVPIAKLRDMGIAAIIASMNNGNINGISSPACFKNSVSVGAVNSNGLFKDYSNVSDDLTLAAPTEFETANVADFVGQKDNFMESFSGTSAATPVVAALFAIGKSIRPEASVSTLIRIAIETAIDIEDVIVKDLKLIQFDSFVRMMMDDTSFEQVAKIADAQANAAADKAATELKAKQEADAKAATDKAAADLKAKQEADAKAATDKAAADLKAKQEADAKAAADKIISDAKAEAAKILADARAKATAPKKTSITCAKGKLTKKVTAVKPKCPAGFKIKR